MKDFKMVLEKAQGNRVYKVVEFPHLTITEYNHNLNSEFYELSTKEVLNVLDYYKVLPLIRTLEIHNMKMPNIQGFVSFERASGKFTGTLVLKTTREDISRGIDLGSPIRKKTLFVLMHEIGHIKGNKEEEAADKWALDNINDVWQSLIKE